MGVYVPADKTAELSMLYFTGGEKAENVFHVLGTAEWTYTLLGTLAAAAAAYETASFRTLRSSSTELIQVTATDLSSQTGPSYIDALGAPIVGTESGSLPNNVTIAIKHNTLLRGRSFRGRTFWIGLWPSAVEGQQVIGTILSQLLGSMNGFNAALAGTNGGQLAVVSRRHNNAPRGAAVVTPVDHFSIESTVDSQRRRLPGHNRHR